VYKPKTQSVVTLDEASQSGSTTTNWPTTGPHDWDLSTLAKDGDQAATLLGGGGMSSQSAQRGSGVR
jgi:hypothetical protein